MGSRGGRPGVYSKGKQRKGEGLKYATASKIYRSTHVGILNQKISACDYRRFFVPTNLQTL